MKIFDKTVVKMIKTTNKIQANILIDMILEEKRMGLND